MLNIKKVAIWPLIAFSLPAMAMDDANPYFAMSLEELLQVRVQIASRHDESAINSASALYIISQEDIKRSGLRTLPEILRLVPGFHVSREDGNKWDINSRRSSQRFSNSMQVLMDGRSLYNGLFGGTYWEIQDTNINDIERIEVIRGPGASSWGANAITGVINIITRSPSETLGSQIYLGMGQSDTQEELTYRYGFKGDNTFTRVFAKHRLGGEGVFLATNDPTTNNQSFEKDRLAGDSVEQNQVGFRHEWHMSDETLLNIQGDHFLADTRDWRIVNNDALLNRIALSGSNLLVKYSQKFDANSNLSLRYYYDALDREDDALINSERKHDLELLYQWPVDNHNLTIGSSIKSLSSETQTPEGARFTLAKNNERITLHSLLLQDRWQVSEQWINTFGIRVENNSVTDLEYNPSFRSLYKFNESHSLWFSATRSVRTPARAELDAYLDFNDFVSSPPFFNCPVNFGFTNDSNLGCIIPIGIKNRQSDITRSYELGLRSQVSKHFNLDIALFSDKDRLPTDQRVNRYYGGELVLKHQIKDSWRMEYQLTLTLSDPDPQANINFSRIEKTIMHVRSYLNLSDNVQLNSLVYYTDGKNRFSSKRRIDLNLQWKISENSTLTFGVNHLFDSPVAEARDTNRINTALEPGFLIAYSSQF